MKKKMIPEWEHHYRIVASKYLPINFFETLVTPEFMGELFFIESLTNDRLRDEVGDISFVSKEDRISGSGSSPVMSAFTHIGVESRFSNGSYGIYYAGDSLDTAIEETKYHRQRFLEYTNEAPGEIHMRTYVGEFARAMVDIRIGNEDLHNPASWTMAQQYGQNLKNSNAWGLVYRSVRNSGGECVAVLRPPAITIPRQGPHLSYVWDGSKITDIYKKERIQ